MGILVKMDNARIGFPTAYDAHHELFAKAENKVAIKAIMDNRWTLAVDDTYKFPFTFERTWRLTAHFMPGNDVWQDLTGTKGITSFIRAALQGSFAHSRAGTLIAVQDGSQTYHIKLFSHPTIQVHAHHHGVQVVISQTHSRRDQSIVNRQTNLSSTNRYFGEMGKLLGKTDFTEEEELPKWTLIPAPLTENNSALTYDAALELDKALARKWEIVSASDVDKWGQGEIKFRIAEKDLLHSTMRSVQSLVDETYRSLNEGHDNSILQYHRQHRYHVFVLYNADTDTHYTVTPHELTMERHSGYAEITVSQGYISKQADHFQFVQKYKRIRERISEAYRVEDRRRAWEQIRYKFQGHRIFITKFPSGMPEQLRLDLAVVFEQNVRYVYGLRVEARTADPNSKVHEKLGDQQLKLSIPELKDMFVNNTLKAWVRGYVYNRDKNELRQDGLELLVVEPSASGEGVSTSWKLSQLYPMDTGRLLADTKNQGYQQELVHEIDFKFNYDVGPDIDAVAVEYLNKDRENGRQEGKENPTGT